MIPKRADFSMQNVLVFNSGTCILCFFCDPWAKTTLTSLVVWSGPAVVIFQQVKVES
jgi:hypothetical protein